MISGHGNIESAVRAIKMGAFDFIEKPLVRSRKRPRGRQSHAPAAAGGGEPVAPRDRRPGVPDGGGELRVRQLLEQVFDGGADERPRASSTGRRDGKSWWRGRFTRAAGGEGPVHRGQLRRHSGGVIESELFGT